LLTWQEAGKVFFVPSTPREECFLAIRRFWDCGRRLRAGLGGCDALLTEIGRATIGFTSRRTARGIDRLKGTRLLDPTYTVSIYYVFRGKVTLTEESS
jgi:hypothetical protein